MQRTESSIEINAPVERVFDLFSNFENFPRWMKNIKGVRYTGDRYTRWTADAPFGPDVEWEAETTIFEPDHRIAWRTVRGDVDTEGEVIFQETRRGTTLLRVVLGYEPPAGRLGTLVARLFGRDPERQLEEDLERFADVVESRGRRVEREGHEEGYGRRPSARVRERRESGRPDEYDYDLNVSYTGARRGDDVDDPARMDYYRSGEEYRARGTGEERPARREREREARFAEALRAARQSQTDGMRRYREERERDEQRRSREGRAREVARGERRWADDERLHERQAGEHTSRRFEEDRRSERPRHLLTPREREQERRRPRSDHEYSREAFRRGVDKLMDEPPSSRWRRWE
ncbi:MAG TPA: SRPBCC family protein [Pyrinomonadaceae bacterium]|nr:SRPBCC family protein [Pyrinomonadaceae bacterium]